MSFPYKCCPFLSHGPLFCTCHYSSVSNNCTRNWQRWYHYSRGQSTVLFLNFAAWQWTLTELFRYDIENCSGPPLHILLCSISERRLEAYFIQTPWRVLTNTFHVLNVRTRNLQPRLAVSPVWKLYDWRTTVSHQVCIFASFWFLHENCADLAGDSRGRQAHLVIPLGNPSQCGYARQLEVSN